MISPALWRVLTGDRVRATEPAIDPVTAIDVVAAAETAVAPEASAL
jgi:hypothetical protein